MKKHSYNISVSFKANLPLLEQLEAFCNSTGYTTSQAVRDGLTLLMSSYTKRQGNTGDTKKFPVFNKLDEDDTDLPSVDMFGVTSSHDDNDTGAYWSGDSDNIGLN